jgi:hypothetical protein
MLPCQHLQLSLPTHIINDIDTSFPNQNMIHLQISENPSSKQKMKSNNTKPCAKTLVWKHQNKIKYKHKKLCDLESQIIKSDFKTHNLGSCLKH